MASKNAPNVATERRASHPFDRRAMIGMSIVSRWWSSRDVGSEVRGDVGHLR